jgi:hypothetical protein
MSKPPAKSIWHERQIQTSPAGIERYAERGGLDENRAALRSWLVTPVGNLRRNIGFGLSTRDAL